MNGTTQLRMLLKEPGMLVVPGCVDAISALVNKYVGFKAVYVTGSGTEAAMLGYPDVGLKTLTEITNQAGRIADTTGLPVICDAEAGFGNYINVIRTVKEFEKAGVAAIHIEDQVTPPNSPTVKARKILPRDEAVGKIKAAVDARTDPNFIIVGRSDANEISIEEVIERCNLYLEAGADIAMPIIAKLDERTNVRHTEGGGFFQTADDRIIETHRRVCREVEGSMLGLLLPGNLTNKEIEALGYSIYIYPTDSMQAALAAMYGAMTELYENGSLEGYFARRPRIDPKIFEEMLRTAEWVELENKYLP